MLIVVGLIVAYFWLAGHWFGRVIAFVLLGAGLSFVAVISVEEYRSAVVSVGILIASWVCAWFLAKIPSIYSNRRAQEGWQVVG